METKVKSLETDLLGAVEQRDRLSKVGVILKPCVCVLYSLYMCFITIYSIMIIFL